MLLTVRSLSSLTSLSGLRLFHSPQHALLLRPITTLTALSRRHSPRSPHSPQCPSRSLTTVLPWTPHTTMFHNLEREASEVVKGSEKVNGSEVLNYDIVIVGAGPAGLSAAIRAKRVAKENGKGDDVSVCVIEKGAEVGSHILSGNVFETRALDSLIPDWKQRGAPVTCKITEDNFWLMLNESYAFKMPHFTIPSSLDNIKSGNYIISLGEFTQWLGQQAEDLGVDVFTGVSGAKLLTKGNVNKERVVGVRTTDCGVSKKGEKKDTFQAGIELRAKQVILGEGCRGSLSEAVMDVYHMREDRSTSPPTLSAPQVYGLGVKEIWTVRPELHRPGLVEHGVGWPLGHSVYGGFFIYHLSGDAPKVLIGMVVGLDYHNPYLSPYQEFQRFKHHPKIKGLLEGGSCDQYGARILNEGGFQAMPKSLTFPGGMVIGCAAGLLNVPKIKGSHTAMESGSIAGEMIANVCLGKSGVKLDSDGGSELKEYNQMIEDSWIYDELYKVRNVIPSFKKGGLSVGMSASGLFLMITKGREPFTMSWKCNNSSDTKEASKFKPIDYPKPDGKISFDILENLTRSGVSHVEDQPCHLRIKKGYEQMPTESWNRFAGPESRFCPAKVYEYIPSPTSTSPTEHRLQINHTNCVHCKACAVKTPMGYIHWTVPEGGGGPSYTHM